MHKTNNLYILVIKTIACICVEQWSFGLPWARRDVFNDIKDNKFARLTEKGYYLSKKSTSRKKQKTFVDQSCPKFKILHTLTHLTKCGFVLVIVALQDKTSLCEAPTWKFDICTKQRLKMQLSSLYFFCSCLRNKVLKTFRNFAKMDFWKNHPTNKKTANQTAMKVLGNFVYHDSNQNKKPDPYLWRSLLSKILFIWRVKFCHFWKSSSTEISRRKTISLIIV